MGFIKRQPAPEPDPRPDGIYTGRLVCAGDGNLLADQGDWKGWPVYHDLEQGDYRYVPENEPGHNARYHTAFVHVEPTTPSDPHHIAPTDLDPHHDITVPGSHTRLRFVPDAHAPTATGHTEAYR